MMNDEWGCLGESDNPIFFIVFLKAAPSNGHRCYSSVIGGYQAKPAVAITFSKIIYLWRSPIETRTGLAERGSLCQPTNR
jgi:hypothetical protein